MSQKKWTLLTQCEAGPHWADTGQHCNKTLVFSLMPRTAVLNQSIFLKEMSFVCGTFDPLGFDNESRNPPLLRPVAHSLSGI